MSRLVRAVSGKDRPKFAAADGTTAAKTYFENLAKYVPAEIIAAFTAINSSLASLQGNSWYYSLLAVFIFFALFTLFYFWWVATPAEKDALRTQQVVSFIAFLIWAYATTGKNGIFGKEGLNIYVDQISTAAMVLFSLVSGFIQPKVKD